jgi:hypothetical protein
MAKAGRPTKYTQAIADRVCTNIASGKGISLIRDAVSGRTILNWLNTRDDFFERIAHARKCQQALMRERMIDLADSATPENWRQVQQQIWDLMWYASKLRPKKRN